MTDASANWVWDVIFTPFGTTAYINQNPTVMNIRFPGQWFQLETGLAYNWHRHYDATTGRYVQPDPLGLEALLSDGPSAYNYVGQAALGRVDPRGEWDSRYLGRAAIKAGLAELAGGGPEDPAADILAGLELALGLGQAILAPNPANDNNDCNPECRQIVQYIYKAIDEIRDRIAALLDDKLICIT